MKLMKVSTPAFLGWPTKMLPRCQDDQSIGFWTISANLTYSPVRVRKNKMEKISDFRRKISIKIEMIRLNITFLILCWLLMSLDFGTNFANKISSLAAKHFIRCSTGPAAQAGDNSKLLHHRSSFSKDGNFWVLSRAVDKRPVFFSSVLFNT